MLKYLILITLLVVLILAPGCERKEKGIISDEKLVRVLVDFHKVNALTLLQPFIKTFHSLDSVNLYEPIFRKHGITQEQFEKTMRYYTFYPLEFEKIYDKVISKLTHEQTAIAELIAAAARDTATNLWKGRNVWSFPAYGIDNRLPLNVPVNRAGTYTLSAYIRMYKDDISINPAINLWFWYDDGSKYGKRDSFPSTPITKDGKLHFYSVSKELTDTLTTHIKGWVFDHKNSDTAFTKNADVYQLRVDFKETLPD